MKKYKLTKETKKVNGVTLFRIQALKNFNDIKKGDLGGWIEREENLSQEGNCWLYNEACVYDNALVCDNACVCDNALVCDNACVCDNARIFDEARVYGESCVSGNGLVCGDGICTKDIINILGLKFDITICDNMVFVGCKSWLIEDINKVKYKEVKKDCSLQEFKKIKKAIKGLV